MPHLRDSKMLVVFLLMTGAFAQYHSYFPRHAEAEADDFDLYIRGEDDYVDLLYSRAADAYAEPEFDDLFDAHDTLSRRDAYADMVLDTYDLYAREAFPGPDKKDKGKAPERKASLDVAGSTIAQDENSKKAFREAALAKLNTNMPGNKGRPLPAIPNQARGGSPGNSPTGSQESQFWHTGNTPPQSHGGKARRWMYGGY